MTSQHESKHIAAPSALPALEDAPGDSDGAKVAQSSFGAVAATETSPQRVEPSAETTQSMTALSLTGTDEEQSPAVLNSISRAKRTLAFIKRPFKAIIRGFWRRAIAEKEHWDLRVHRSVKWTFDKETKGIGQVVRRAVWVSR